MGIRLIAVLLLAVLEQVSADLTVGAYNYLVDPGRIYTWRQKWMSSQIELSKSNQGATGVDVTFFVNPSTGLSNGIFEVTFPSGFDLKSVSDGKTLSVTGQVVQLTQSFPSETDIRITIPRVTNPSSAGAYGPFAIRTRLHSSGQIIDANLSFGSVSVSATEGKLQAFTVAYSSGSTGTINRPGNVLTFAVTLTKSMWAHDLFKITVPSQFSLVSPVCRSVDLAGKLNSYNGTYPDDVHALDCVTTQKVSGQQQVLWIFGLATDADLYKTDDNRNIQLSVTGFTNPDRCYPDSSYVWILETIRFNTFYVLESGTANGPKTIPGSITTASWTPTWGRSTDKILSGQTIYMDMTITLADPLTAGGSLEVTHSGTATSWGSTQCYLVTSTSQAADCQVDATKTTKVTGLVAIPANGKLIIRHLISFVGSDQTNQILSVTSKSAEGYQVDTAANLAGFKLPAATAATSFTLNVLLQNLDLTLANKAGGPGSGDNYLKLEMTGISGLITATTTTITISCPQIVRSSKQTRVQPDDFQFNFVDILAVYKASSDGTTSNDFSGDDTKLTSATSIPDTSITLTSGSMAIAATGATTYKPGNAVIKAENGMASASALTIGFHAGELPSFMMIPSVVTNAATAYECAVDITNTGASSAIKPASGVGQFLIVYQDFDKDNCKFTYFCKRGTLAGTPVKISFSPKSLSIRSDAGVRTYYVDIEMPTDLYEIPSAGTFYNSGVKEGGVYPMDSTISGNPSMTVQTINGAIVHRLKGLGEIAPFSPVDIFFPVNKAKGSNLDATIKLSSFYTMSSDLRVKYYTHSFEFKNNYGIDTTTASDGGAFVSTKKPGSNVNGNRLDTATMDFQLQASSTVLSDTYFYIVLPRGYSFSSFRDVLVYTGDINTQVSFPWKKYFSSPNLSFAYPGVLVKTLASGARISANAISTLSIRGLNLPIGATTKDATFVHGDVNGDLTAACLNAGTLQIELTSGVITTITVSPQTVLARGPGGVDATYTLMFILPHGIDQGGSVKLSLDSEWSATTTTGCTVAGLSDISNAVRVSCSRTGTDFTITNFADFNTAVNTKVTVLLTHIISPKNENVDKSSRLLQILRSLISYTSDGLVIDTYDIADVNGLTKVTVLTPIAIGSTNYISKQCFPPNANVGLVELYVKVSFPYDLPASSLIVTNPPYAPITTASDMREKCHLSPLRYNSCVVSGGTFAITLDEGYKANTALEVFIHQGVTAPTDVPASTSPVGFKMTTSWFGVTITEDKVLSQFTVQPKINGTISVNSTVIDFTPRNAYESATYKFTFTSSIAIKATDKIIIMWPQEFDPYLAAGEQSYQTETGSFYVPCSSPEKMGTTYCVIDHWAMLVQGTQDVEAAKEITITVPGVRNPPAGTTGAFLVWQINQNQELIAINTNIGKVTSTALAKELDIRKVDVTSRQIANTADYNFQFYLSDSIGTATELWFVFPPEVAISLLTPTTDFQCAATYTEQSTNSGKTDVTWNSNTSCKLRGKDTITLPASTTVNTFTSSQLINVKLSGVPTPEWALERSPQRATWDFDDINSVSDKSTLIVYSWWTNQFKIFVYQSDTANRVYLSRSYSDQNSAYLGFLQPLRTFVVNAYNPQNRNNRIIVYPGTQSPDIAIMTANSSWPLQAKHVTFAAKVNPNTPDSGALSFTSFRDNWIMLQDEWAINFRVSAAANALKGLYFITWSITEGKQLTVTSNWYSPPPQTLVEVPAYKASVYSFQVSDIPPIPVGTTSLPVKMFVTNAPHTSVAVTIEVEKAHNNTVSVSPATLNFVPDLDSLYFTITVSATHDFEYVPRVTLNLKLSGTNAALYSISPALSIRINKAYYPTKPKIATIGVADITRTSFTISPSTDQLGLIYYAVNARGAKVYSLEELKALMPNFEYTTTQLTADGKTHSDERTAAITLSDPPDGVEWNYFQHQLFSTHMTSYLVYGAVMMRTTTTNTPITIPKLWADSVYQIVAYLDNLKLNGTVSEQYLKYVWTLPIADFQPVALTFAGDVPAAQSLTIRNILAKYIGVNPARLQNYQRTVKNTSVRRMQNTTNTPVTPPVVSTVESTTLQYYLVANRSLNWPTPTLEATFSNERNYNLRKELQATLAITSTIVYSLPAIPAKVVPTWLTPAQLVSHSNTTATVQYRSSSLGKVCCAAMPDSKEVVIPDQVVEGYSYNWTKVPSACGPAYLNQTVDTLNVVGLKADTVYSIHCVAMDSSPLWPTLMTYTTANPMPFVSFHTPLTNDPEIIPEAGIALQLAAILWLFLA